MKTFLTAVVALVVALVWIREKVDAAGLQTEIAALRLPGTELDALRRERERLRELQPGPEALAALQRAAVEHGETKRELAARERAARSRPPEVLSLGEWLPPSRLKNRGDATPAATVETALWAAAGGDVAVLKAMLRIDEGVRAKADALLVQLPANARATYPDAEQLIAAFTINAIPLGDAQVVWQHQHATDEAVVCVFVRNLEATAAPANIPAQRAGPNAPPVGPSNTRTHSAYLALRRGDNGWRLVVPKSAVDKIAKELGLRTASR